MVFQPVPKGIKIEQVGSQNGTPVVNIYHVEAADTVTLTDLENACEAVEDWWDETQRTSLNSSYTLTEIVATDISVANGQQARISTFTNPNGANADEAAAGNAAVVISWRTAFTGRSYRGRTYVGGLSNASLQDAQTLSPTTQAGFSLNAADLIDKLEAVGLILSVLSRWAGNVLRATGILTQIIGIIVDDKVDSQRRRTRN